MRFHHHAIRVRSLQAAEAFYCDLLGLPIVRRWEDEHGHRATWVALEQGFLALERVDSGTALPSAPPEVVPGHVPGHYAFMLEVGVEARADLHRRLETAGFPAFRETAFTFYVRDPDGSIVGFSHYPVSGTTRRQQNTP